MWSPETQQWHPGSQRARGKRASTFPGERPSPIPGLRVSHPEHLSPGLPSLLHQPVPEGKPAAQVTSHGESADPPAPPCPGPPQAVPEAGWGRGREVALHELKSLPSRQDAPYSAPGPHLSLPSPSGPGEEDRGRPKLPPYPPRPGGDGHAGEDVNTGSVPQWKWNHRERGGPDPTNSGLRFGSPPPDPEWSEGPREGTFLTTGSEWRAS